MKREDFTFSGWAVVYDTVCTNGDIFMPGSMLAHNYFKTVPLLLNHDRHCNIGEVLLCPRDATTKGVYCHAYLDTSNPVGQLVYDLIKEQRLRFLSVGVSVLQAKEHEIYRGIIFEVSICIHNNPKNEECIITKIA